MRSVVKCLPYNMADGSYLILFLLCEYEYLFYAFTRLNPVLFVNKYYNYN